MLLCHWCQSSEKIFEMKNKEGSIEHFPMLDYYLVTEKTVGDGVVKKKNIDFVSYNLSNRKSIQTDSFYFPIDGHIM